MNFTSDNLRDELWDTLKKVKNKTISTQVANSVAAQAREIVRTIKTEIQLMSVMNKHSTKSNLTSSTYKKFIGHGK